MVLFTSAKEQKSFGKNFPESKSRMYSTGGDTGKNFLSGIHSQEIHRSDEAAHKKDKALYHESVHRILFRNFAPNLAVGAVRCFRIVLEIDLVLFLMSQAGLVSQTPLLLLFEIFGSAPITAYATLSSQVTYTALAMKKQSAAVVFFSQYFFVALMLAAIYAIIFGASSFPLYTSIVGASSASHALAGVYAVLGFVFVPIGTVFADGLDRFFSAEGRTFLVFVRGLFFEMVYAFFVMVIYAYCRFTYTLSSGSISLVPSAVAYIIAVAVQAVWALFVMYRVPIFDINYKSDLHFSLRKIFPISGLTTLKVALLALGRQFADAAEPISLLIVYSLYPRVYKSLADATTARVGMTVLVRYLPVFRVFGTAFAAELSNTLMRLEDGRRYRKVRALMLYAILYSFVFTIPYAVVLYLIAPYILPLLLNYPLRNATTPASFAFNYDAAMGAVLPYWYTALALAIASCFYNVVFQVARVYNYDAILYFLAVARIVVTIVGAAVFATLVSDGGPFYLVLPFAEGTVMLLSIVFLAMLASRYGAASRTLKIEEGEEGLAGPDGGSGAKGAKAAKAPKAVKAVKTVKTVKTVKDVKAVKTVKEPKPAKAPAEAKKAKEPKAPRAPKASALKKGKRDAKGEKSSEPELSPLDKEDTAANALLEPSVHTDPGEVLAEAPVGALVEAPVAVPVDVAPKLFAKPAAKPAAKRSTMAPVV